MTNINYIKDIKTSPAHILPTVSVLLYINSKKFIYQFYGILNNFYIYDEIKSSYLFLGSIRKVPSYIKYFTGRK